MKVFQLKLFCNNNTVLKKVLSIITLWLCLSNLNAQEKSNIQLRIEAGPIIFSDSENLALFLNVEPKLKSSENTIFGLRIGVTVNSQTIKNNDILRFYIDDQSDNGVISFVPTYDYYFNNNNFRPNVGFGVGYYVLAANIEVSRYGDIFEGSVKNQLGFLLRGGFELGSIRLGLEYNNVSKANIEIPDGQIIGTVENSYFGLSIGFTIGLGK